MAAWFRLEKSLVTATDRLYELLISPGGIFYLVSVSVGECTVPIFHLYCVLLLKLAVSLQGIKILPHLSRWLFLLSEAYLDPANDSTMVAAK